MVKNPSDVNACSYQVMSIGLKKAIKGAMVSVAEDKNIEVIQKT